MSDALQLSDSVLGKWTVGSIRVDWTSNQRVVTGDEFVALFMCHCKESCLVSDSKRSSKH